MCDFLRKRDGVAAANVERFLGLIARVEAVSTPPARRRRRGVASMA